MSHHLQPTGVTRGTTGTLPHDIFGSDKEYMDEDTKQSLFSGKGHGDPEIDIGVVIQKKPDTGYVLESDEQKVI